MHGIPAKTLDIDAMVLEDMPIEPIIVPDLLVLLILQVWFKVMNQACIGSEIINKHFGPVAKIVLRPCKEGGTDYLALANRGLIFDIQVNGLSIPGDYVINFLQNL